MNYEVEPLIINTDDVTPPSTEGTRLWENRESAYHMYNAPGVPKCSIAIQGYNRLNKTKYCVECVLNYTKDVDYELILVDNGSDDGTLEYFQSVPYENKQIIRVTKNIEAGFPIPYIRKIFKGKYLVIVNNDVYVTQNWLSNLLECYESDPSIGFVVPLSSNVSNRQQVDLRFSNFEQMQKKAADFNKSDPMKWEERLRLINLINILSRSMLDIIGFYDSAYVHDFLEDDLAVRLRRSGYKLVLCGDTWVHHDHDFRNNEDKDPRAFMKSLESGRRIYQEKYHGIDAWDDVNNFEDTLLSLLNKVSFRDDELSALCVDVRCGTPVLEIRNSLRKRGRTNVKSSAFTSAAKYFLDLQTVAEDVICDRIEFIGTHFVSNSFNIIAVGQPINTYQASPITLIYQLYGLLKPGGVLMFKLRNTDDYNSFLRSVSVGEQYDPDLPTVLCPDVIKECLKQMGGRSILTIPESFNMDENNKNTIRGLIKRIKPDASELDLRKLLISDYCFSVIKG